MISDEELINEVQSGSKSAMDVLIRRYYKLVFAYIYRKVMDRALAYDLTQEVFIKVIKKINHYSDRGSFKNWVLTIAVNHCRDYFRSAAAQSSKYIDEFDDHKIKDRSQSISSVLDKKQNRRVIMDALKQLPDTQVEVILLKYFHDLKIREIAEMTRASESTVKSRLYQGIGKLETLLERGEWYEQGD